MSTVQRRASQGSPAAARGAKPKLHRVLAILDWLVLMAGTILLACLIFTSAQANISADAVDYYAILQRLTPAEETPIVRNLPFVDQRSPGYSIAALGPYTLLSTLVDPLVETEKVVDAPSIRDPSLPGNPPPRAGPSAPSSTGGVGSEFVLIPPAPLLLRDAPFKDFSVPVEGSWFQWKLALSLAATSYAFLFLGMAANARTLRHTFPALSGVSLTALSVFTSALFLQNVVATPLYATLTAFGMASLFALFFVRAYGLQRTWQMLPAGFFLGFLVLTRLELAVLAVTVAVLLILQRRWSFVANLTLGAAPALLVWLAYNAKQFGTPLYLGILKGDINTLTLDLGYVVDSLVHPASGLLWWSPLLIPGLLGLLLCKSRPLRILGTGALALLALYLVRVPVMYQHLGESFIQIGGIAVTVPNSPASMRELVRSDINRYATVPLPFALLGLHDLLGKVCERILAYYRWTKPLDESPTPGGPVPFTQRTSQR